MRGTSPGMGMLYEVVMVGKLVCICDASSVELTGGNEDVWTLDAGANRALGRVAYEDRSHQRDRIGPGYVAWLRVAA
jgi:hypothetical protein